MGIINATPDSFYSKSTTQTIDAALVLAEKQLLQGASILDIGGQSTKPFSEQISATAEAERVIPIIGAIAKRLDCFISIDSFYSEVVLQAVQAGACMVNDISAGSFDDDLLPTIAMLKLPYVLMHMQGKPVTMQQNPVYTNVVEEVFSFMETKIDYCKNLGIEQLVLDLGFGFGKTIEHNYTLLKRQAIFKQLGYPLLTGISRKGMIYKPLQLTANEALNGTTAMHILALQNGANLLRVHDVAEAKQAIDLWKLYEKA